MMGSIGLSELLLIGLVILVIVGLALVLRLRR